MGGTKSKPKCNPDVTTKELDQKIQRGDNVDQCITYLFNKYDLNCDGKLDGDEALNMRENITQYVQERENLSFEAALYFSWLMRTKLESYSGGAVTLEAFTENIKDLLDFRRLKN